MHGHQHIFISQHKGMVNNRVGSEFAGLSYEKQLEKILAGQKILKEHGIETDVFFAPAHSYDYIAGVEKSRLQVYFRW